MKPADIFGRKITYAPIEGGLRVTHERPFGLGTRVMDLPITVAQMKAWEGGLLIQDAMPNLTPGQREFLLSGLTDEEFNKNKDDT